jgi:hypothetical protein
MESENVTTGDVGPEDVAEKEAERIADETSAEQLKPDTELVAPTSDESEGSRGAPAAAKPKDEDDTDAEERYNQGSGTPSVSIGEQQTAVRPPSDT